MILLQISEIVMNFLNDSKNTCLNLRIKMITTYQKN